MKVLREAIRDPRVAAAVCVLAVALLGYRIWRWRVENKVVPDASTSAVSAGLPAAPPPAAAAAAPSPEESARAVEPARPFPSPVNWKWDRNPFLSPRLAEGGKGFADSPGYARLSPPGDIPWNLRGTILSEPLSFAVFGNRLVPAGEQIGGWVVTRVEPYRVTLRKGEEERIVELSKPVSRSGPAREGEGR